MGNTTDRSFEKIHRGYSALWTNVTFITKSRGNDFESSSLYSTFSWTNRYRRPTHHRQPKTLWLWIFGPSSLYDI